MRRSPFLKFLQRLVPVYFFFAGQALAGSMALSWTAPPAPAPTSGCVLTKIQLDYGTAAGTYTKSAATATAAETALSVTGLDEGRTYYFAAKTLGTCNGAAESSGYSNEVSAKVPIGAPGSLRLSLAPVSATFVPTKVGATSTRTWSINNRGSETLRLGPPEFDDVAFGSSSGAKTLAPGGQVRYSLTFSPVVPGYAEARMTLRTATAVESYPLTGFGLFQ
jgi:hypothetical protein